jgi:endonuclease YncB( thermonuclease family)
LYKSKTLSFVVSFIVLSPLSCLPPQTKDIATPKPASATPGRHEPRRRSQARIQTLHGLVVGISDGDTITIRDEQNRTSKIRLQGIDAPEKRQDFSNVSRQHLAQLVAGKEVDVEYEKLDQHGRIVGKVMVNDLDVCLEQIKAGLAWHYKYYEGEQTASDREEYATAETRARAAKLGLWQYAAPTPPWDFRHEAGVNRISSGYSESTPPPRVERDATTSGQIIGNRRSMIYHWPGCPYYNDIAPSNRVYFASREEAEKAGYRASRNCN